MGVSEWGDLDGRPVVLLHGTPGSRLCCPDGAATEAAGVRLLTMDRPGYGRSDPRPNGTVWDWVDDFVDLIDQLEVPSAPVVGWSGGGPYALACAVRAPGRVPVIGLAASVGPTRLVPDALDSYPASDRAASELLARDRDAGASAVRELFAWYSDAGWEAMFGESWGDVDDRVIEDPTTLVAVREWMQEGARQGPVGFVDDWVVLESPWGFTVAEVRQPVHVWWGSEDPAVSRSHTDYLARTLPRSILHIYENEGHMFPIGHWGEMLMELHEASVESART